MKNKEIEEMLMSGASLDDLIKMKIEQEFMNDMKKSEEKSELKIITDLKKVPKDKIFSKDALYKIFNRNTKCETYINGVQAEALTGIQNNIREKLLKAELSAFTTDDSYVKFVKVVL